MERPLKNTPSDFVLLTGSANPNLAKMIAYKLEEPVYSPTSRFGDDEVRISKISENMREKEVFIIQPTNQPDSNLMEVLAMADAARRASAKRISAVIPYFGYARQDKKMESRTPITAKVAADMLVAAGVQRILTMDIHAEQIMGFVNIPWDNIYGSMALIPKIAKLNIPNLAVSSADMTGIKMAKHYRRGLNGKGIAMVWKEREQEVANKTEVIDMIGDVDGMNVLVVDDMGDTFGSLVDAAEINRQRGAQSVWAAITHGLFNGPALQRFNDSCIEELFVTDSVELSPEVSHHPRIHVVTSAEILATGIKCMMTGESMSEALKY